MSDASALTTSMKSAIVTGASGGIGRTVGQKWSELASAVGVPAEAAIGIAQNGHVIATVQISPQVTSRRQKARDLRLTNLRVEKLDLLDPYDVAHAQTWNIDVLFNNAGVGECGPVSEIPIDLVRRNFETNTSSAGGLLTPPGRGVYVSTKHALEAFAEAMQCDLRPFGAKVQTINPGAYLTGFNETMADTPFR